MGQHLRARRFHQTGCVGRQLQSHKAVQLHLLDTDFQIAMKQKRFCHQLELGKAQEAFFDLLDLNQAKLD